MNSEQFRRFLDGKIDLFDQLPEAREGHDLSREEQHALLKEEEKRLSSLPDTKRVAQAERRAFKLGYLGAALICCITLAVVLLYMTANITSYGKANPRAQEVAERYIEEGVEETGAVNAVAGMILDYRAFDTLGESHVLFTALVIVIILLGIDSKNRHSQYEDYFRIQKELYFATEKDSILHYVGGVLGSCILLFGIYILLNGHLGPGGGFSGGAVIGSGLIVLALSLGDDAVDRLLTEKRFKMTAFIALTFYSFAKGYVFFTGANGIPNHIPKGTPGAILSAGLILPLDIAVGLVVGCTMYGFFSLLRRGMIGGEPTDD